MDNQWILAPGFLQCRNRCCQHIVHLSEYLYFTGILTVRILHYLNAPNKARTTGYSWWEAERDLLYFEFDASAEAMIEDWGDEVDLGYKGFDESVSVVLCECERAGPFEGALGCAHGGDFASYLVSHPSTRGLFRYAICMSGFPCRVAGLYGAEWYYGIDTPSRTNRQLLDTESERICAVVPAATCSHVNACEGKLKYQYQYWFCVYL